MHIVNNIDIQYNTSNVTSFVHTTSKKHTYDDFFYIKCYRMHSTVLITNCQELLEPNNCLVVDYKTSEVTRNRKHFSRSFFYKFG